MQNIYRIITGSLAAVIQLPIPFKFLINDLMLSNIILDSNTSSSTSGIDQRSSSILLELAFKVMASRYITAGTLAVSC